MKSQSFRDSPQPVVKRLYDAASGFPESPILPVNPADPGIFRGVFVNDLAGPVGRTIIHNDPFDWLNGLGNDTFDRGLEMFLFVADRCDDGVFHLGNR